MSQYHNKYKYPSNPPRGHEEYRQTQTQSGPYYANLQPLLLNTASSTHDMNKSLPPASGGMYQTSGGIPGIGPQHHQPGIGGPVPAGSMIQGQQVPTRSHMPNMTGYQGRPTPPSAIQGMSRPAMGGGVAQTTPQQLQQFSQVQNVVLSSAAQYHAAANMQQQHMVYPHMMFQRNVPFQQHQQYPQPITYVTPYYNSQPNSAYYGISQMPPPSSSMNNIPVNPQPQTVKKKKILTIMDPSTGKSIWEGQQNNRLNESSESKDKGANSEVCSQFAAQVAVLAEDVNTVPIENKNIGDDSSSIPPLQPMNAVVEDRSGTGNGEIISPDVCDSYRDENVITCHEPPDKSFRKTNRIESNNVRDSSPSADEKYAREAMLQCAHVEPSNFVNHDSLSYIEDTKPYIEDTKPYIEDTKPYIEDTKPYIEDTKPYIEDTKPYIEDTKPYIEDIEPYIEDTKSCDPCVILQSVEDSSISAEVCENLPKDIDLKDNEITNSTTLEDEPADVTPDTAVEMPPMSPSQYQDIDTPTVSSPEETGVNDKVLDSETFALKLDKPQIHTEGGKKPSKKNKKKELNKKGKEGSEMDAFLVTSDIPPPPSSPQPSLTESSPASPLQESTEFLVLDEVGGDDSMDIDVAAIENSVSEVEISNDASEECFDETTNEDVDMKKDETSVVQEVAKLALEYSYKEDQWSPLNPEGKKQYDREFLIKLQSRPMSLKKPSNLPNLDVIKDKAELHRLADINRMCTPASLPPVPRMAFDPFVPNYARGINPMRPPHSAGRRVINRDKPKKVISFSTTLSQVKLHESENAWKPAMKADGDDDEAKNQDLYKRVRGILNKLTPQKFDTLVKQVKDLDIATEERLNSVIDLVFEKAIDEPNFSVPYANMCKELAMLKVPVAGKEGIVVNFRKLLLIKCQREFEQDRSDELMSAQKSKEIEQCDTEEKKKQLQEELAEQQRKNRRRQLGNIRFIGELFKLNMLIEPIMHECIAKLLHQGDEDSLECLCRLLSTIGKELETKKDKNSNPDKMNSYMKSMQKIVEQRKTSSRVRFMLQDVIDLRKENWIPRRDENNPKTIDQIHKEAEREQHEQQQILQSMPFLPKRPQDDRRKMNNPGRTSTFEDGWINTSSKSSKSLLDNSKYRLHRLPDIENNVQLGGFNKFATWSQGSSGGNKAFEPDNKPVTANRFYALADNTTTPSYDSRRGSQRSAASSRESSRGRSNQMVSPIVRKTPSTSREREGVLEAVRGIAAPQQDIKATVEPKQPAVQSVNGRDSSDTTLLQGPDMSIEEMEKKAGPLMDEFCHNNDYDEAIRCIGEIVSPNTASSFISAAVNHVLERSSQARSQLGQLLHNMVKQNMITMEQYNKGLSSLLEYLDDFSLDIPKIWDYVAEIVEPMVQLKAFSFLEDTLKPCIPSQHAGKVVSAILHHAAKTRGNLKVGEMWRESGLQFTSFLPPDVNIAEFIKEHILELLMEGQVKMEQEPPAELTFAEIKKKLDLYLKRKSSNEEIFDWIESNVGSKLTSPTFIRALTTAMFENSIEESGEKCEFSQDKLKERAAILQHYVTPYQHLQLQTVYALQALMNELQHPKGVLNLIFNSLYDDDLISDKTFKEWEGDSDPAEQEGKVDALSSVSCFLTWLREDDPDSVDDG